MYLVYDNSKYYKYESFLECRPKFELWNCGETFKIFNCKVLVQHEPSTIAPDL